MKSSAISLKITIFCGLCSAQIDYIVFALETSNLFFSKLCFQIDKRNLLQSVIKKKKHISIYIYLNQNYRDIFELIIYL